LTRKVVLQGQERKQGWEWEREREVNREARELQGGWDEGGEWPRQRQLKWWDGGGQGELTGRYQGRGWELEVAQEWELEPETREREREPEAREREPEERERELGGREREARERELEGQGNGRERHHPPQSLQQDQVGLGGT
jgi:hypothetical protein